MPGPELVHVDLRAAQCQPPRRTGMVEVNVRDEHVPDVIDGEAQPPQPIFQGPNRCPRPGLDDHRPVIANHDVRGDRSGLAQVEKIDGVNVHDDDSATIVGRPPERCGGAGSVN